jgi:hypothetical protein
MTAPFIQDPEHDLVSSISFASSFNVEKRTALHPLKDQRIIDWSGVVGLRKRRLDEMPSSEAVFFGLL